MIPTQNEPHPIFAANDEYIPHPIVHYLYGFSPDWPQQICRLAEASS